MQLSRFPRVALAHLPTPLEPLDRLSALLGGPRLWIKRDDCTGLALGGNKTRKLEFLVGAALEAGADTLVTAGGVQSNHARQTAAAAARMGLACELVLVEMRPVDDPEYPHNGNRLLDQLLGATVHGVAPEAEFDAAYAAVVEGVRRRGGRPYAIPTGGSNEVGALGYAVCAHELERQADAQGTRVDWIVHASASGGTQGGLLAGLAAGHSPARVLGVNVYADDAMVRARVSEVAGATAERLGLRAPAGQDRIELEGGFRGAGYGIPTPEMVEAVELFARHEGIVLDPVYTGKAAAALVALVRRGRFRPTDTVVFLHTGGTPALAAYRSSFAAGA